MKLKFLFLLYILVNKISGNENIKFLEDYFVYKNVPGIVIYSCDDDEGNVNGYLQEYLQLFFDVFVRENFRNFSWFPNSRKILLDNTFTFTLLSVTLQQKVTLREAYISSENIKSI